MLQIDAASRNRHRVGAFSGLLLVMAAMLLFISQSASAGSAVQGPLGGFTPTPTATATPLCGTGGNYVVTQSTSATVVPGTFDIGNHCDDCVTALALPFPVQFYDQYFSAANVSSNGVLQFLSANASGTNHCLPWSSFNYAIAALWDDLDTSFTGEGVFTSVTGTAPNRVFTIEWRAHSRSGNGTVNPEIQLNENSSLQQFDIVYGLFGSPNNSATVGAQRDTGSQSTVYVCNGGSGQLTTGLQLTFHLVCGTATASPTTTRTPSSTSTSSVTPTSSSTSSPTRTASSTSTVTTTRTSTATASSTSTSTFTNTATATRTSTATASSTSTATSSSTNTSTSTFTNTPTNSSTSSPSSTATASNTGTATASSTSSSTVTHTSTSTPSDTATETQTNTPSYTSTSTSTDTATATATDTASSTSTDTPTSTPSDTATNTPTDTATNTATNTSTNTPTNSPTNTPTTVPTSTLTPVPCTMNFSDVAATDWFYDYVQCLYCRGAISGYADGTFRPGNNTIRGQMAKIVVLMFSYPMREPSSPTFNDVLPTNAFYGYIETAASNNIVTGYGDGSFRPYANVTRGQLCKITAIGARWQAINPSNPTFSDVLPGSAFYQYVETAYCHQIVDGYGDGTFRPDNFATRAQIAKIVCLASRNQATCGVVR